MKTFSLPFLAMLATTLNSCIGFNNDPQATKQSTYVSEVPQSYTDENKYIDTSLRLDTALKYEPPMQTTAVPKKTIRTPHGEIIQLRIQNTLVATDKIHPCAILIDTEPLVMTLTALNGVDVFKLIYEGNSTYTFNFYNSDGLQASKTIYRRVDLEDETDAQIYTNRTGEITITISNQ